MTLYTQANVVPSDKRTVSGHTADFHMNAASQARFLLAVTQAAGTSPSLDVRIEAKTQAGNYLPLADFTQITAVGGQSLYLWVPAPNYRISWTIGGTSPSFTFELDVVYPFS